MRPVSVFANAPGSEVEQLQAALRGRWRQAAWAMMVLVSAHGLPPAQIAELLDCHPSTVRRWIGRFNGEGMAGLAGRSRPGRPRLGGQQLAGRIAALLRRPGPWTLPRIRRYLGWPQVSALIELPRRPVVLAEDETHLNLLPHVRASWTLRTVRPQTSAPGSNRQVTVFGAVEVTTGAWVYRLGKRCAADFIALPAQVLRAFPAALVIVMICGNDSIHHARTSPGYRPVTSRTSGMPLSVRPSRRTIPFRDLRCDGGED